MDAFDVVVIGGCMSSALSQMRVLV